MKCSICEKEIEKKYHNGKMFWDKGHNAEPINDGRCCDDTEESAVIERMNLEFESLDGETCERILEDVLYKKENAEFIYQKLTKLDELFRILDSLKNKGFKEEILVKLSGVLADRKIPDVIKLLEDKDFASALCHNGQEKGTSHLETSYKILKSCP